MHLLADSTKGIFTCYKKCMEHYGYRIPNDDEIFATIGHTIKDSIGLLIGEKPVNVDEMHKYYVSLADEYMVKNTEFYPKKTLFDTQKFVPNRQFFVTDSDPIPTTILPADNPGTRFPPITYFAIFTTF